MGKDPYCHACGLEWGDHDGPETLCRRYRELADALIDWHVHGGFQLLHDLAAKEIDRRNGEIPGLD